MIRGGEIMWARSPKRVDKVIIFVGRKSGYRACEGGWIGVAAGSQGCKSCLTDLYWWCGFNKLTSMMCFISDGWGFVSRFVG